MPRGAFHPVVLGVLVFLGSASPALAEERPIADFTLRDFHGKEHVLSDYAKAKLVVTAFIGTDCPLANRYADRLADLAKVYEPRGVIFLAIDSNQQDSLAQLAHLAKVHHIEFPVLKDPGNLIADRFGAKRTPEVFVLDTARRVRYRGRIDDQFGIGYMRPAPKDRDLVQALDELLAGKPVTRPVTEVSGCYIGRVKREAPHGDVTYANQISRLIQSRCVSCHRAGGIGPFSLTTYQDAAAWAETIDEVVHERRMPPWDASPKVGKFADDPSLSEAEIRLVEDWVKNGVPEGDPKQLPKPAQFVEGWRIPKPDLILTMPKMYRVPAQGTLPYQYFTVDPGFTQDMWVRASEVRPGTPSVVHHVVVIVQPPGAADPAQRGGIGDPIAVWAPGAAPMTFPEGAARIVPAGSKLVFQMHYTPKGVEQIDRTSFGLLLADPKKVERAVKAEMAVNVKLRIPPGDSNYQASADYRFGQDSILYALYPHMHLRGKSFKIEAIYPDKKRELLLDVPRYRFDWQSRYTLAQPLRLPEGTILHCDAHFDNSPANLSNPDPKAEVRFGEQTWDEMLVGYFDVALADQDLRLGPPVVNALPDGNFDVRFTYRAKPGSKAVYLSGGFNQWKMTEHKMDGPDAQNRFTTKVVLKPGRHEYKFVIDGREWWHDPGNLQPSAPVALNVPGQSPGRWLQLPSLATPHQYAAGVALRGKIYAVGGPAEAAFEEYDPAFNKWTKLPPMPTPRMLPGAAGLGQKIYAAGGITTDLKTSANVEAFDVVTGRWSKCASLEAPRNRLAAVTIGDRLFAIGGMTAQGNTGVVEEYDPAGDRWLRRADMPTPRHGHAAAAFGDKILVAGGYGNDDQLATLEEYDPAHDRWTRKLDMPAKNGFFGLATVGSCVYALGGRVHGAPPVFRYDPKADRWTRFGIMPGTFRNRFGTASLEGKIFILGGELQEDRQLPFSALIYEP